MYTGTESSMMEDKKKFCLEHPVGMQKEVKVPVNNWRIIKEKKVKIEMKKRTCTMSNKK